MNHASTGAGAAGDWEACACWLQMHTSHPAVHILLYPRYVCSLLYLLYLMPNGVASLDYLDCSRLESSWCTGEGSTCGGEAGPQKRQ